MCSFGDKNERQMEEPKIKKMKFIARILIALITFALLSLLMTGCYTKKQAIEKFCRTDTASIIVTHVDTLVTPTIQADTVFSIKLDSIILVQDRLEIRYRKIRDSIFIEGKCKGDTIINTITLPVKIPVKCPPCHEPDIWDKLLLYILYILALYGAIELIGRIFNKLLSK